MPAEEELSSVDTPASSMTQPQSLDDAPSTSGSDTLKVGQENKDSCVPKFDALWFCYCE